MEVSECGGVVSEVGVDASGVVERLRHLRGESEVVDDVEYQAVGCVYNVGLVTSFDSEEIVVVLKSKVAECRRVDGSERVDGSLRLPVSTLSVRRCSRGSDGCWRVHPQAMIAMVVIMSSNVRFMALILMPQR